MSERRSWLAQLVFDQGDKEEGEVGAVDIRDLLSVRRGPALDFALFVKSP